MTLVVEFKNEEIKHSAKQKDYLTYECTYEITENSRCDEYMLLFIQKEGEYILRVYNANIITIDATMSSKNRNFLKSIDQALEKSNGTNKESHILGSIAGGMGSSIPQYAFSHIGRVKYFLEILSKASCFPKEATILKDESIQINYSFEKLLFSQKSTNKKPPSPSDNGLFAEKNIMMTGLKRDANFLNDFDRGEKNFLSKNR